MLGENRFLSFSASRTSCLSSIVCISWGRSLPATVSDWLDAHTVEWEDVPLNICVRNLKKVAHLCLLHVYIGEV